MEKLGEVIGNNIKNKAMEFAKEIDSNLVCR
jgi:hypothetical protein